jgi:hypothetical protein
MRSRILPVAGAGVAALALAMTFAPSAGASGHAVGTAGKSATQSHAGTAASCYAQRDNDNGIGIVSQNFESTFDAYDAMGADDFKLKKTCKLKTVTADGIYFNGSGPADSFNVVIYKGKSKPGGTFKACNNASYTDSGFGSPVVKCKAKLTTKAKWVSVQANLAFSAGGEWGWNTNNTVRGKPSQWQNPGDGFATGCTSWTATTTCIPSGEGGDNSFSLN